MKVMSIDLEMNQPSGLVCEVGAAIIDLKTGELVDTFQSYVYIGELMNPETSQLTGITDDMLIAADRVFEVYMRLKAWKEAHGKKVFMNPIVWGSGTHNDSGILFQQAKRDGLKEENFMGHRVVDAKVIYQSFAMINGKGIKGGLETCLGKKLKLGWDDKFGPPHRALADAYNTARAWHFMATKIKI